MIAHGTVVVIDEELPRSMDHVAAEELVEDIDDAEACVTTHNANIIALSPFSSHLNITMAFKKNQKNHCYNFLLLSDSSVTHYSV